MQPRAASAVLLVLALACGVAIAGPGDRSAQLGVGVIVRPTRPAPRALATLPLPPGARPVATTPFGGTYHSPASARDVALFLRNEMNARGYRLVADQPRTDGARLLWQRAGEQVEFECRDILGATPASRIVVVASARREG